MLNAPKSATATLPTDTRLLVVLPLLYRAWAILRTRHVLAWFQAWAPPALLGYLKDRDASDSWSRIMTEVENACS